MDGANINQSGAKRVPFESLTTKYKVWTEELSNVDLKHADTTTVDIYRSEIDEIDSLLTKTRFVQEIAVKEKEVSELRNRLLNLRAEHSRSVKWSAPDVKEIYRACRGIKWTCALEETKDPDVLRIIMKETFNFCLETITDQLIALKNVAEPDKKDESRKEIKSSYTVEELLKQKICDPEIAALQSLVAKDNLTHILQMFKSSRWPKLVEFYTTSHACLKTPLQGKLLEYVESSVELSWCMCTNDPLLYFVWEDNEPGSSKLFKVDGTDKKDLKVVHPALVKMAGADGYEIVLKGLKQSKMQQDLNEHKENETTIITKDNDTKNETLGTKQHNVKESKQNKNTTTESNVSAASTSHTIIHVPCNNQMKDITDKRCDVKNTITTKKNAPKQQVQMESKISLDSKAQKNLNF